MTKSPQCIIVILEANLKRLEILGSEKDVQNFKGSKGSMALEGLKFVKNMKNEIYTKAKKTKEVRGQKGLIG